MAVDASVALYRHRLLSPPSLGAAAAAEEEEEAPLETPNVVVARHNETVTERHRSDIAIRLIQ